MFYRSVISKVEPGEERGPRARRQREVESLRHLILDAAEEILTREGCEALSIRRLAEAVEYAPSTIYGYFDDKKAILTAVVERTTGAFLEALSAAAATPGPLTRLRMLGRAYVEFALHYPRHYEVLFLQRGGITPEVETPAFTAAIEHFREALDEGVKKGVFRRLNAEETAQAFWAACHGLIGLLLTHGERYPFAEPERLVEALLTMQLEGLRPQAFGLAAPALPRVVSEPVEEPESPPAAPPAPPVNASSITANLARQAAWRARGVRSER